MESPSRAGITNLPVLSAVMLVSGLLTVSAIASDIQLPTTEQDFFNLGTQPDPSGNVLDMVQPAAGCEFCHGNFEIFMPAETVPDAEPFKFWSNSMMGQAARDPVFYACLTIANQDAEFAGTFCLRCHTTAGWLEGRVSTGPDAEDLVHASADFDGVVCHFCHRMVDPVYERGVSPDTDAAIVEALELDGVLPDQFGNGSYVIDPEDRRRGPFDLDESYKAFFHHAWEQSPFHQESQLCATCHEVSNPLYMRQKDGTYAITPFDAEHPTLDKFDMFPLERTYSEWANSDFANGDVELPGRFTMLPDQPLGSCQDCHMPDTTSWGCSVGGGTLSGPHTDMPRHFFAGANSWVLRAVRTLYTDEDLGEFHDPLYDDVASVGFTLTEDSVDESIERNMNMLKDASDMELTQMGNLMNVRITNYSGHKLPTGYPEGRRMWLTVTFLDDRDNVVTVRGDYDFETADLNTCDTKVYEVKLGIGPQVSKLSGLPEGESFHFAMNNVRLQDNRIPPMGFTNAAFEAAQAHPVGATYEDGQYWDDTTYAIPNGAEKAVVTLYHQTTTREYIEFLRDENVTNDRGEIAYQQWEMHGKSAPVDMDTVMIEFDDDTNPGDLNGDGVAGPADLALLLGNWGPCSQLADINGDGSVGPGDLALLLGNWG